MSLDKINQDIGSLARNAKDEDVKQLASAVVELSKEIAAAQKREKDLLAKVNRAGLK